MISQRIIKQNACFSNPLAETLKKRNEQKKQCFGSLLKMIGRGRRLTDLVLKLDQAGAAYEV